MTANKVRLFASFFLLIGVLFFVTALQLPASPYEPIGAGTLPAALSAIICVLSLAVIAFPDKVGAVPASRPAKDEPKAQNLVGLTVGIMVLFAVFVLVMQADILGFVPATILFLGAVMTLMTRNDPRVTNGPRAWFVTLAIALVTGFGLQFVFTKLLVVNLP